MIESKKTYNQYTDKGLVWELVKIKIRSTSIPYCINKKTNMNSFKNKLLKEINLLETELDNNPTSFNLDKFNASKNELEQIEKHKTQGHILRSKISWTEDGEKTSKYVLNLEKTNYCNKLISSLEVDNKLIKDPNNIAKAEKDFFQQL